MTASPKYRIQCRYKNWIGKPDPSGFGTFSINSNDSDYLNQKAHELTRKGHKVYKFQKHVEGKWVTM